MGSITDGDIEIFHNPSGRTMALVSIQEYFLGVKAAGAYG